MNRNVVFAIFRRNFASYLANPTGYVFICVYVLLSSFAAFWPNEFFSANLCNLDQLNRYLPYIMLVFIPAITMSIWAEERRQGTDELLLTIPAGDFDVVAGKYLAAVAIFSVALLFSLVCNAIVLGMFLGRPDMGLLLGTYFGYWLVGLSMLSIGMVASFLTGNLTVGFVLGALFNAPLVFAANADVILPDALALEVRQWSLEEQFRDFGRGVISLAGVLYFVLIVLVNLYLSMVLIGRRHWQGGRDGRPLGGHYLARAVAGVVTAACLVAIFHRHDVRADVTQERLSSLAPQSRKLIRELDPKRPVRIDAYVSPQVPESFVQTRLNLLGTLQEFAALGGAAIQLHIHTTLPLSEEAERAEQQFGITSQKVLSRSRGAVSEEDVYLGVAFTSRLEKVVVPFIDSSVPLEYELVRSIATVSQQERKKLGVLATDAKLIGGGFDMQTFTPLRDDRLIEELKKQYEVVSVNADSPVPDDVDVLFAVQPSTLNPAQMKNFLSAVRQGVPTAIFEDPFPLTRDVTATADPKRPQQTNPMFGGMQPPQPKGRIADLWKLLGIDFAEKQIVWQDYNPQPKLRAAVKPEWLWIDSECSNKPVFSEKDKATSGLQELLLLFAGSMSKLNASDMNFEALVATGDNTGTVLAKDIMVSDFMGRRQDFNPRRRLTPTRQYYVVAAHITGKVHEEDLPLDEQSGGPNFDANDDLNEEALQLALAQDDEKTEAEAQNDAPTDEAAPAADDADRNDEEMKDADKADTEKADTEKTDAEKTDAEKADTEKADTEKADTDAADADRADHDHADESKPAEKAAKAAKDGKKDEAQKEKRQRSGEVNVVLVTDLDLLYSQFFNFRSTQARDPEQELDLHLDNVTFVLNVIDELADDDRFIDIRKRRPKHRTLERIEEITQVSRNESDNKVKEKRDKLEATKAEKQQKLDAEVQKIASSKDLSEIEKLQRIAQVQRRLQANMNAEISKAQRETDDDVRKIERELAVEINRLQDGYKLWAVVLPPVPPLLIGLAVYFSRRAREREGVARSRLR